MAMAILEDQIARPTLTEAQEDQLDRAGLSSDFLDLWSKCEAQALQHSSTAVALGAAGFRLSFTERWEAAQWVHSALQHGGLAKKGVAWTEVLTLLDSCDAAWLARGAGGRLGGQSLPVACLAVVSILAKSASNERVQWARLLTQPMAQSVHDLAKAFLNLLQWRIQVPSLQAWVSTLTRRVAVLSNDLFEAQIRSGCHRLRGPSPSGCRGRGMGGSSLQRVEHPCPDSQRPKLFSGCVVVGLWMRA